MAPTDPKELPTTFEDVFDGIAFEALQILYDRQRKYGPENIRQQGLWGILTRIKDDKIERVRRAFNGVIEKGAIKLQEIADGSDDDTFEDALFDIANYALIMVALKRGVWGKPMREDTGEIEALAAGRTRADLQLMTVEEARQALLGEDDGTQEPEAYEDAAALDDFAHYLGVDRADEPASIDDATPEEWDREAAAQMARDRVERERLARNLGGQG